MAAKLILSLDGAGARVSIPLTKERIDDRGVEPHNDIQIDNLAISGEHSVIVTILNDSFLEDLNSTNGTYVNGQPIKKYFLQNNDVVELGKSRLQVHQRDALADKLLQISRREKTMVLRPDLMKKTAEQAAAKSPSMIDTQVGMKAADTQAGISPPTQTAAPAPAAAPPQAMPVGIIQILSGETPARNWN